MAFCDRARVADAIRGKRVAVVGSGPGVLDNDPGFVDSHDVVIRVNNYKLSDAAGFRADIFYSFFGSSIKKTAEELKADGVYLCMCKCPDQKILESKWHRERNKPNGVDFRYIYAARKDWWFCDTYVPTFQEFMHVFYLLGSRIPTTGFSALYEVLELSPTSLYITGFDFFSSGIHNVNERWKPGDPSDPIGHAPEAEKKWLHENARGHVSFDRRLESIIRKAR